VTGKHPRRVREIQTALGQRRIAPGGVEGNSMWLLWIQQHDKSNDLFIYLFVSGHVSKTLRERIIRETAVGHSFF
jgi:hypothetical protein